MLINAILPIFLLIVFGYALKKSKIVDNSFWKGVEELTYYVFFPALLISKMATTELDNLELGAIAMTCMLSLTIISFISFFCKAVFKINNFSFGSVYQGTIRFNTYIGLAIVNSLFQAQGVATAIIIASILIPAVNICSVIVLQLNQSTNDPETKDKSIGKLFHHSVKGLLKNPLILSCLIGLSINFIGITIPAPLFESIHILGTIALPMGLMAVGAALVLNKIQTVLTPILISSTLKLILYPFIAFWLATLFDLNIQTKQILVIFIALPTATASYILARNMQSDHQLMARVITIETLLSGMTLLAVLALLNIN